MFEKIIVVDENLKDQLKEFVDSLNIAFNYPVLSDCPYKTLVIGLNFPTRNKFFSIVANVLMVGNELESFIDNAFGQLDQVVPVPLIGFPGVAYINFKQEENNG